METKIIDNFLDEQVFKKIANLVIRSSTEPNEVDNFPWRFTPTVAYTEEVETIQKIEGRVDAGTWFMSNIIYDNNCPQNKYVNDVEPLLNKITEVEKTEIKSLLRIRANFYPHTPTLYEHPMHADRDYSHTAVILSLNTCDGYTKLVDDTKVESVANRAIFFDAGKMHCSTTTTDAQARFNIIVNYLGVDE